MLCSARCLGSHCTISRYTMGYHVLKRVHAGAVPSHPCSVAVVAEDLGTTLTFLRRA